MIKVQVDFYTDTFRSGILEIPEDVADALKGKKDNGERGNSYWAAIDLLKSVIAGKLGIKAWDRSFVQRALERQGRYTTQPITIINIQHA